MGVTPKASREVGPPRKRWIGRLIENDENATSAMNALIPEPMTRTSPTQPRERTDRLTGPLTRR